MLYWSPGSDKTEVYEPRWSPTFSDSEKLQCTNLFFFFKNKKGFKELQSESLAHMVVFKNKYSGLRYSDEQEEILLKALKPVCNS